MFYLVIQSGAVRRAWNPRHGTANYPYLKKKTRTVTVAVRVFIEEKE